MRKLFALTALLTVAPFTVANASPPASSEPSAQKDPNSGKGKAKPGEACKVDNDCDQTNGRYSCQKNKCQANPAPLPPT